MMANQISDAILRFKSRFKLVIEWRFDFAHHWR